MSISKYKFHLRVSSIFWLIWISSGYSLSDSILLDCGSPNSTTVGGRVFEADNSTSHSLSTSDTILANTNSISISSSFGSDLYRTARIFKSSSQYTFPIKSHGRHWIRLYFFPFSFGDYNMSDAKFSVSAQNITLLRDFQVVTEPLRKEYSLNITANQLVLTFTPSSNSFAFINAIEILPLPDNVIPEHVKIVSPQGDNKNVWNQASETVYRVNMGNQTVSPENDSSSRLWVGDGIYVQRDLLVDFVSNMTAVNFTGTNITVDIAPTVVYGTLTRLKTTDDPRMKANVTWHFNVDPGFDYLLRFHFCDIVKLPPDTLFNVFVDSWLAFTVNLRQETSNKVGMPFYIDAIARISDSPNLNVSVGTIAAALGDTTPPGAILNGLEIMKLSNSKDSLVLDSERSSKKKLGVIVALVIVPLVVVLAISMALFLVFRRRCHLHLGHEKGEENYAMSGMANYSDGTAIFSSSKIGYRFPLAVIQEATNNFSEDLVIGVGGFGKVYKGVLKDETKVAVKRGASHSHQGLTEFRTEIEMLSQFRHRHLVSLIGYCNEQNERIIIYEYMEKGTLKNHLYESDVPCLSWKQRLEICIGAARGLHYLHTGSAKPIIHRDVKSANILLDENFVAKVADFGLSKTGPEIDQTHVSTAVKGSFGYLDPEYLTTQQLTEKSDIYSYGVVMFEVLCGRPVIDPSLPREKVNLIECVMRSQERRQLEEMIDPRMVGQVKLDSLQKFVEIAEKCLAEHGVNRPTMGDVLWHLEYALRLLGVGERSNNDGDVSLQICQMNHSDTGLSSVEYSMGSVGDLSGVSMGKVFAQMVREDMR